MVCLGGLRNWCLGSLSDDFKKLKQFESEGGTMEEIVRKMEKYRSEVNGRQPSDKYPRFMSLTGQYMGEF